VEARGFGGVEVPLREHRLETLQNAAEAPGPAFSGSGR
jgi:hypothetical protein